MSVFMTTRTDAYADGMECTFKATFRGVCHWFRKPQCSTRSEEDMHPTV